uniref:Uncharacterized protein n=1 Tax=Globodera rostochiensis TaxID=31243 RepID=A0A914I7G8_GLORO
MSGSRKTSQNGGQVKRCNSSNSVSSCEFLPLAVVGCTGCENLVDKAKRVRHAWREHLIREVTEERNKAAEREKKEAIEREKQIMSDSEKRENNLKGLYDEISTERDRLSAVLTQTKERVQELEYDNSTKQIHLERCQTLIEKYARMRVDAIGMLEQLLELVAETTELQQNNNNDTTTTHSHNEQKKYQETEVQTDSLEEEEQGMEQARAVQPSPVESTMGTNVKTLSAVGKLANRLARKRIELTNVIDDVSKKNLDLKSRASSGAEEEDVVCNGGPLLKRARESSPVEYPTQPSSVQDGTVEEDDDDIMFVEVVKKAPSTPPTVRMNGSVSTTPGSTLNNSQRLRKFNASSEEEQMEKSKEEEDISDGGGSDGIGMTLKSESSECSIDSREVCAKPRRTRLCNRTHSFLPAEQIILIPEQPRE